MTLSRPILGCGTRTLAVLSRKILRITVFPTFGRYADPATMRDDGSHDSIWYPCADLMPVREIVYPIMAAVRGTRLGGVLITRIKPGQI